MRKYVLQTIAIGGIILLSSCQSSKPLYSWYDYSNSSYRSLKVGDGSSKETLEKQYLSIINQQQSTRNVPPPGVCADYGFFLLQTGRNDEGKKMLMREIELYPESKIFIDRILNRIGQ